MLRCTRGVREENFLSIANHETSSTNGTCDGSRHRVSLESWDTFSFKKTTDVGLMNLTSPSTHRQIILIFKKSRLGGADDFFRDTIPLETGRRKEQEAQSRKQKVKGKKQKSRFNIFYQIERLFVGKGAWLLG